MIDPNLPHDEQARLFAAQSSGRMKYAERSEEIDELVLQCGAAGYSEAQTAACIGVSKAMLQAWAREYPHFAAVLSRASTLSQARWEGMAMDGTAQGLIGQTVWTKSMAARFPDDYTDRQEQGRIGEAGEIREIRWSVVPVPVPEQDGD